MKKFIQFLSVSLISGVILLGCNIESIAPEADDSYNEISTSEIDFSKDIASRGPIFWWLGDLCFIQGTSINTTTGLVNVEDIVAGDEVYGAGSDSSIFKVYERTMDYNTDDLIVISTEGNELVVTGIHPIIVLEEGKVTVKQAKNLKTGDTVFTHNGARAITINSRPYECYVYNLSLWSESELEEKISLEKLIARTYYAEAL